jgi:hypothetical protein
MRQKIVGFHQDNVGDWVADLACGHTLHLRHNPPWQPRDWILSETQRREKLGQEIECPHCERFKDNALDETAVKEREAKLQIATATRAACLKTLLESYEFAKMSGMCQEGAWEFAIDQLKQLDVEKILDSLP